MNGDLILLGVSSAVFGLIWLYLAYGVAWGWDRVPFFWDNSGAGNLGMVPDEPASDQNGIILGWSTRKKSPGKFYTSGIIWLILWGMLSAMVVSGFMEELQKGNGQPRGAADANSGRR